MPDPSCPGWVRTCPAGASNSVTTAPTRMSASSSRSAKMGMARSFAMSVASMVSSLPGGLSHAHTRAIWEDGAVDRSEEAVS